MKNLSATLHTDEQVKRERAALQRAVAERRAEAMRTKLSLESHKVFVASKDGGQA